MSPALVLIGPMGAGKSRIGKRIAKLLDVPFVDTDRVIVAEHGPIAVIFAEHGETRFRELERAAVAEALQGDGVVALGGGAVLDPATQADLADQRVVLLTVSAEAVAPRIAGGARPLVAGGIDDWVRIRDARMPIYERLADIAFDTSSRPATTIAEEVAAWTRQSA
ncbi:shikimate kinase [Pseudolysinimonas sp.]|uniref:shikimate kinase n=1 Tax=Pseudolysinimonas sp. TaxID=2680009 RepID=UPI003F7DB7F9